MAEFQATAEQVEIYDRIRAGWSFVVEAGAGTGKTSTQAAAAGLVNSNRQLYIAYNKPIVEDAEKVMPSGVTCKTAHGLAFGAIGYMYVNQIHNGIVQGWQIAKTLNVRRWAENGIKISGPSCGTLARNTVKKWSHSTDPYIDLHHVPIPEKVRSDKAATESLRHHILGYARRLWNIAQDPSQTLFRFDHDWYLKLFSMLGPGGTVPAIPFDMIWFDECQDADPVIRLIFEAQTRAQRVAVGDSQQAIYAWRGAENAITRFREAGAPVLTLTTSFRFGQVIADEANLWLDRLDADIRLTGNPALDSSIGPIDTEKPHMVLCRTNAGVMAAVMRAIAAKKPVAMVGGGKEVKALAIACEWLYSGRETDHPELMGFESWDDLIKYTEGDDCDNPTLRTLVRLAEQYEPAVLAKALGDCVTERQAQVRVSTAHKAKGRQAEQVFIGGDFAGTGSVRISSPRQSAEAADREERAANRLAYVAATRARRRLDNNNLRADGSATEGEDLVYDPRWDDSATRLF